MDVTPASAETGIGRYTRGLATALVETCPPSFRVTFVSRRQAALSVVRNAHHIPSSRLTYQVLGASFLKRFKPAVYVGPDFTYPSGIPVSTVVVAHDLIPWNHPEWVSHRARILYRLFGTPCLRNATVVLADSEFTAGEFRQVFRRCASVVYPGISEVFTPAPVGESADGLRLPGGREIPSPYLLFVGALDARRCADLLLESFLRARKRVRRLSLVLVGKLRGKTVRARVHDMATHGVHFAGTLPDGTLTGYYRGASAVVYLSSYEGFGYPPVEALACQIPALVSDIPVFRETLGDFASFVPLSASPQEVSGEMLKMLDPPSDSSKRRRARDYVRDRFSWGRSANAVWDIIRGMAPRGE
jgi:glycosyltransferase involved in cell wall biosynthesis